MQKEIITNSPGETKLIAQKFACQLKPGDILALTGNLGTGKTCFAKGIIEELTGISENFQGSPTFALIQEYQSSSSGIRVNHFDFYRVKNAMEMLQIGWQEYIFDSNSVCVIEWADLFPEILPPETRWIKFASEGGDKRKIVFRNP
ncbi:tRNA (adenosine(37)-N6)-threonylcarbamoyltransferase complex ATPase subunit type 1 TsaE [bacterium]|nr:tRNA (adenosine(37)-N6)-threonylcarbamoyltransferase complex ATPase subunit type 1 TsaE [bacterium]